MTASLLACALFGVGMYGVLTRRDVIGVLVALEVMLGASNLQLVVLASRAAGKTATAEGIALLVMVLAAAEAAVGLALLLAVWRRSSRTRTGDLTRLEG